MAAMVSRRKLLNFKSTKNTALAAMEDQMPPPSFVAGSLKMFMSSTLNLLLLLVPVALMSERLELSDSSAFTVCCLAILPLAGLLGFATEQVAIHTGDTLSGLLNATLGNARVHYRSSAIHGSTLCARGSAGHVKMGRPSRGATTGRPDDELVSCVATYSSRLAVIHIQVQLYRGRATQKGNAFPFCGYALSRVVDIDPLSSARATALSRRSRSTRTT